MKNTQQMDLRKWKRLVVLVVSGLLSLMLSLSAGAAAPPKTDQSSPVPSYAETGQAAGSSNMQPPPASKNRHFGRQLATTQERELYVALGKDVFSKNTDTRSRYVEFSEPIFLDQAVRESDRSAVHLVATVNLQRAVDAFRFDHPEMYWVTGGSVVTDVKTGTTPSGRVAIRGAVGAYQPAEYQYSQDDSIINRELDRIAEQAGQQPAGYLQLKKAHDLLAQHIRYETGTPPPKRAHQITGGLVDQVGVCETYAKSFKLIADRLGYETVLVGGIGRMNGQEGRHMWNYVQLEGQWYGVDITWNDQARLIHDFFLVGSKTQSPYLNFATFDQSHVEENVLFPIPYAPFSYPTLSQTAYKPSAVPQEVAPVVPEVAPEVATPEVSATTKDPLVLEVIRKMKETSETTAQVKIKDVPTLEKSTAEELAALPAEYVLKMDTVDEARGHVEGRITFSKAALSAVVEDLKMGVHTNDRSTKALRNEASRIFTEPYAAVSCAARRSLSASVRVAVYVDLEGMNTQALTLYLRTAEGVYTPLPAANYQVDEQGYVHFSTSVLGDFIITDQTL